MSIKNSSVILHISKPVRNLIKRFSLVTLLLLSIFIIFLTKSSNAFFIDLRTQFVDYISPVIRIISAPIDFIFEIPEKVEGYFFVYDKNKTLLNQNKYLKRQLALLTDIESENSRLRKLLRVVKRSGYSYITARVIGDTSGPFFKSILVNVGVADGVKNGQAVINEEGLVGRVIEVGSSTARILLITDINSKIPVISRFSRERSIASGNNDDFPELIYLAADNNIHEGEQIITSGDGELFPPGLKLGVVYSDTARGKYKIRPLVNWNSLEYVSIINYNNTGSDISHDELKEKISGNPENSREEVVDYNF